MFSWFRKKAVPKEDVRKEQLRRKMQEGYPITQTPWIPSIMDHAVCSKTFEYGPGEPMLKLTFGAEGSNLVGRKSLKMIQDKLLVYYHQFPRLRKEVITPFPRNTIAISFSLYNFKVGEGCNEFSPFDSFGTMKDSYFNYQKLSENVQATYYHENGIEYLAGLCYFPVVNGMPDISKSDKVAIVMTQLKANYFPLEPRSLLLNYTKYKAYGRYCGTAKKRVLVSFNNPERKHRHCNFDFVRHEKVFTECKECEEDAVNYKYVKPNRTENTAEKEPEKHIATLEDNKSKPVNAEHKYPALSFLESAGIGIAELNLLNTLSMNSKIPMIHETSMDQLPKEEKPELQDLLRFVMANPKWKIDKDFVSQLPAGAFSVGDIRMFHRESGVVLGFPLGASHLASYLDAHQDINVHPSSSLIAQFVLGTEYKHRIGEDSDENAAFALATKRVEEDFEKNGIKPDSNSSEVLNAEKQKEREGESHSDEESDVEHVEDNLISFSEEDFELVD